MQTFRREWSLNGFCGRTESGQRNGGEGLAEFINNRWCNSGPITVKGQLFRRDVELLANDATLCPVN